MKHSKSQAALEYLVTYGWAFIVIIGAIGLLAYFGLINPTRYVPESCEFGEQLTCLGQYVDDSNSILLRFKNNFEESIDIIGANGDTVSWYGDPTTGGKVTIASGEIGQVKLLVVNKTVHSGDKEHFNAVINFERTGGSIMHNLSGTFYAEVSDSKLGLLT